MSHGRIDRRPTLILDPRHNTSYTPFSRSPPPISLSPLPTTAHTFLLEHLPRGPSTLPLTSVTYRCRCRRLMAVALPIDRSPILYSGTDTKHCLSAHVFPLMELKESRPYKVSSIPMSM